MNITMNVSFVLVLVLILTLLLDFYGNSTTDRTVLPVLLCPFGNDVKLVYQKRQL